MLEVISTALPDVKVLVPRRFGDDRGWFSETWNKTRLADAGIDLDFVQDSHSASAQVGTMRGLHYQAPPHAQDKLVRCTRGAIADVAVDVREGSPTYGQWVREELSEKNGKQLLVPKGFLHGFVTLQSNSEVQYKVTDYYDAESDKAVRWDSMGIDWGLTSPPTLSEKDQNAPMFVDWASPFKYERTT
jgi:dTDP-4-dehydrorhamnose 3,5-epimerase